MLNRFKDTAADENCDVNKSTYYISCLTREEVEAELADILHTILAEINEPDATLLYKITLPKLNVLGRINKILIHYLAVEAGDNVILRVENRGKGRPFYIYIDLKEEKELHEI